MSPGDIVTDAAAITPVSGTAPPFTDAASIQARLRTPQITPMASVRPATPAAPNEATPAKPAAATSTKPTASRTLTATNPSAPPPPAPTDVSLGAQWVTVRTISGLRVEGLDVVLAATGPGQATAPVALRHQANNELAINPASGDPAAGYDAVLIRGAHIRLDGRLTDGAGDPLAFAALTVGPDPTAEPVLRVAGQARISGDTALDAALTVTGASTLTGAVTAGGDLRVDGTLTVGGATELDGTLAVHDSVTVDGSVTIDGSVIVNATVTVDGTLTVEGTSTLGGALTANDTAQFARDVTIEGPLTARAAVQLAAGATADGALVVTAGGAHITGGLTVDGRDISALLDRLTTLEARLTMLTTATMPALKIAGAEAIAPSPTATIQAGPAASFTVAAAALPGLTLAFAPGARGTGFVSVWADHGQSWTYAALTLSPTPVTAITGQAQPSGTAFTFPAVAQWGLTCFQPGGAGGITRYWPVTATRADAPDVFAVDLGGVLCLAMNDQPGGYGDNSGNARIHVALAVV